MMTNRDEILGEIEKLERRKEVLNGQQMAVKIMMNSLYGASFNQHFRYFDPRIAEGITMTGRFVIRTTEKFVNNYLNNLLKTNGIDYCVAIDTDSNYFTLAPVVNELGLEDKRKIVEFLSQFAERIEKELDKAFAQVRLVLNAKNDSLQMNREVIAESAVWTGKKHYFMLVNDTEGVAHNPPKMKIVGMESKKSSTPSVCREKLKELYRVLLETKDESVVKKFVYDFQKEFDAMNVEDIAFPRGISDIRKYADSQMIYKKGCPIHVRAALLHNTLLEKHGLKSIKPIDNADKIKYVYLSLPNPINEDVIGFIDGLPEEFGLHKYVDRKTQFEKSFIKPMEGVFNEVGWDIKKRKTLKGLFKA